MLELNVITAKKDTFVIIMMNLHDSISLLFRKIQRIGMQETFREIQEVVWSHYQFHHIIKAIDLAAMKALQARYERQIGKEENNIGKKGKRKYFAVRGYMIENLRYVHRLGLQKSARPFHLLDIGTGFGYFPFLCQYFGHTALGIDLTDFFVFNEMVNILNVRRTDCGVYAYHALPDFGEKFDIVTCFRVCFDRIKNGRWGVDEWAFFLADLKAHQLNEDGRIFLRLNYIVEEKNTKLLTFFRAKGAHINFEKIYFTSLEKL